MKRRDEDTRASYPIRYRNYARGLTSLGAFLVATIVIIFGNLGCFEDLPQLLDIVLRREIVFDPWAATLVPDKEVAVGARMTWGDDGKVTSDWNIYPDGLDVISSAVISPKQLAHQTTITLTGASHDSLYGSKGTFTTAPLTSRRLKVTATYEDPLVKGGEDFGFKPLIRTQTNYLPLKALNPRLELKVSPKPTFGANGAVESISLTGRAEVIDAPPASSYDFAIQIRVGKHAMKTVSEGLLPRLLGSEPRILVLNISNQFDVAQGSITNKISSNGQSVSFSAANIPLGSHSVEGWAIREVSTWVGIEATEVGGAGKKLKTDVVNFYGTNRDDYLSRSWQSKPSEE